MHYFFGIELSAGMPDAVKLILYNKNGSKGGRVVRWFEVMAKRNG